MHDPFIRGSKCTDVTHHVNLYAFKVCYVIDYQNWVINLKKYG